MRSYISQCAPLLTCVFLCLPAPVLAQSHADASCNLTMSAAVSPDGTTGWAAQFMRGTVKLGTKDTIAPYGPKSALLDMGTYALTTIWTKTGKATITEQVGTLKACVFVPPVVTPPPPPPPVPSNTSASFLSLDSTTQGTWKGVYGAQGYMLATDPASLLPVYAAITPKGGTYTWELNPVDVRALQKAGTATGRTAATWVDAVDVEASVALTDNQTHRLSLYLIDWDRQGRQESVQVLDAVTGALLDERHITSLSEGVYITWSVKGSVVLHLHRDVGPNAIYSGIFIDPPSVVGPPPPPPPAPTPVSQTASLSFTPVAAEYPTVTRFVLRITTPAGVTAQTVDVGKPALDASGNAVTPVTLTLLAGQLYKAAVQACSAGGCGTFSTGADFAF